MSRNKMRKLPGKSGSKGEIRKHTSYKQPHSGTKVSNMQRMKSVKNAGGSQAEAKKGKRGAY